LRAGLTDSKREERTLVKRTLTAILMCAVMVMVAAVPIALAGTHTITKGPKGPNASAVTWDFTPTELGVWVGNITNNGLRWVVVDVYDNSSAMPVNVLHERIRFAAYNAYPNGMVDTLPVVMMADRPYAITITPNGPRGSTCTVVDMFTPSVPPTATFTWTATGLSVAFDASGSTAPGSSITTYDWDFGDGMTASLSSPTTTHLYGSDGTYPVTLTVTAANLLTATDTQSVTVSHAPGNPTASFTATMDWNVVTVDGSGSSDPNGLALTYDWDFGDGSTGSGVTATHTYAASGSYVITLTVTNTDLLTGTATQTVNAVVPMPPVAMFSSSMNWNVVSVDASGSYDQNSPALPLTYAWDFGDGSTGTGVTATHTYATAGSFTITLTVTNTVPLSDSTTGSVTSVLPMPPVAMFTASMDWMTASVDASASYDQNTPALALTYAWDFGDGSTGTGVTATHTYAAAGSFTITLTVTNTVPLSDSTTHSVTAVQPMPPVALFTPTMTGMDLSVDASASYDQNTPALALTYAWDFGDGSTGTGVTATHTYLTPGTYTVTLTVTNTIPLSASTSHDVIAASGNAPPIASFTVTYSSSVNWQVSFDASGSFDPDGTISAYDWNFGDGTTGTGSTATHTYAFRGTWTVTLTVTDNGGAQGSASQQVQPQQATIPPQPFPVFGYITDSLGNPVYGAYTTLTDTRTGAVWTYLDDQLGGIYQIDLNWNATGWAFGDTLVVTSTLGALSGTNSAIVPTGSVYLEIDVVVS
jgi:PKD repeat protein